ncbi:MAG: hydroxyacylglutathione hydrolase [Hyphomicrobiaceae bacterium]
MSPSTSALEIHQFPCLSDNYGVLIHDPQADVTASIDAPDADAVETALKEKGWTLTHILTTHHHADHTGGNAALKAAHGCHIVGPRPEQAKIPGIDEPVGEGDTAQFGNHTARVFETPGHTAGHISYWFEDAGVAFVGDTLFALGCGRLFEGSAETMWTSLQKLMKLPEDTVIYCGHEYTLANAEFALTVDPQNAALKDRAEEIRTQRAAGQPTLPTTLGIELATNPFLRAADPGLRRSIGLPDAADWEVFAEVRHRKDNA